MFANSHVLQQLFDLDELPEFEPRYNIPPTSVVGSVLAESGAREWRLLRWGLIPNWAKDDSIGTRLINARSETVFEKPAFRAAIRRRRCLIPTTGYFEWQDTGAKRKQPYLIALADRMPFAFGGIWEYWETPERVEQTFSVLTTVPSSRINHIHDRMPVIIDPTNYDLWLDPKMQDPSRLAPLFAPDEGLVLAATPVDRRVGNPGFDVPEAVEPISVDLAEPRPAVRTPKPPPVDSGQGSLF